MGCLYFGGAVHSVLVSLGPLSDFVTEASGNVQPSSPQDTGSFSTETLAHWPSQSLIFNYRHRKFWTVLLQNPFACLELSARLLHKI